MSRTRYRYQSAYTYIYKTPPSGVLNNLYLLKLIRPYIIVRICRRSHGNGKIGTFMRVDASTKVSGIRTIYEERVSLTMSAQK